MEECSPLPCLSLSLVSLTQITGSSCKPQLREPTRPSTRPAGDNARTPQFGVRQCHACPCVVDPHAFQTRRLVIIAPGPTQGSAFLHSQRTREIQCARRLSRSYPPCAAFELGSEMERSIPFWSILGRSTVPRHGRTGIDTCIVSARIDSQGAFGFS